MGTHMKAVESGTDALSHSPAVQYPLWAHYTGFVPSPHLLSPLLSELVGCALVQCEERVHATLLAKFAGSPISQLDNEPWCFSRILYNIARACGVVTVSMARTVAGPREKMASNANFTKKKIAIT